MKGKYEFLLNYPQQKGLYGLSYNRWRQTLSPTVQREDNRISSHYVDGYEADPKHIGFTGSRWGGLTRSMNSQASFIDGSINNFDYWYSIGSYGREYSGSIPGPNINTVQVVELYVNVYQNYVNNDFISCDTRISRSSSMILYVYVFLADDS